LEDLGRTIRLILSEAYTAEIMIAAPADFLQHLPVAIQQTANLMSKSSPTLRAGLALAGFIIVTFCAPLLGFAAMPGTWYASLVKPAWNPPPWIFGPAWTLLYTLMAVAAWLAWKQVGWRRPLLLYFVQLALNAAWTPIFFGAHHLGWALLEIVALWLAILLTTLSFHRVNKTAGALFVPYLAWVTFATCLNFALWHLNPP
jgi:tryptophan-rich sensory protein